MHRAPAIKWVRPEAGEPFYQSADGRFEIAPLYCGRERPQGWEVRDNSDGTTRRTFLGLATAKRLALARFQ